MSLEFEISVVIPVKDGEKFLPETLDALLNQVNAPTFEVCIYNDGSSDGTQSQIEVYVQRFRDAGIGYKFSGGDVAGGVGYAKNRAVRLASAKYVCFNDADDICQPNRLRTMFDEAEAISSGHEMLFLGSQFSRIPDNSTTRYTNWANSITDESIKVQIYTSNGPTLTAPTWFVSRSIFEVIGMFREEKHGYPEDLELFYRCLDDTRVKFHMVPEQLVVYRYHPECASFGVSEKTILKLRQERLRRDVLSSGHRFIIWNAGKQGKQFFKSLTADEKSRIVAFCDVDEAKIRRGVHEEFDEKTRSITHRIPILHVRNAVPPLIVCVKQDMTNGEMEALIADKKWRDGVDLVHFG